VLSRIIKGFYALPALFSPKVNKLIQQEKVTDMPLLYEEKVKINSTAFTNKVRAIADKYNLDPNWLMVVMNFETGGTFSPSIRNSSTGATGLIQFMPATAQDLGTTTDALASMTNVAQLDYVDKYYSGIVRREGTIDNVAECYLAVFYPAAIPWAMDKVFPDMVYRVNKVFDLNKDGTITKQEIINKILSTIPAGYTQIISQKKTS